jgi:fumarate reductase subunit C
VDLTGFLTAILSGIAAVLVAAIANTLLPGVRWARWLKRDLDIHNGLPDGFEKDLWREDVEWQAERLRRYTVQHPWWAKFGGWLLVMLAIFVAVAFLVALILGVVELLVEGSSDTDWIGLSLFGVIAVFLGIVASDVIRGREAMQTVLTPVAMYSYGDDDLVGLAVVRDGERVGAVVRIDHVPAEDLIVIGLDDREVVVPFDPDHVERIDLDVGTLTMTPEQH